MVPAVFDAFEQAIRDGSASKTDLYRNAEGTWITAFAPVVDDDGAAVAMLAVDYRVDVYLTELGAARRRLLIHSLAGALIATLAGALLARRITRPVVQLAALARDVVEGDLMARAPVHSRDEIGLLANTLHLLVDRVRVSHRSIVDVLVRALETRRGEPGALRRVAEAARALAEPLGLSPAQQEALELGALLHDIGEIRTPDAIWSKPAALDADERRVVEHHPGAGVELLESVPLLTPALDVVAAHHERWDGSGYPRGLREEAIPLVARIFGVADALDSMTHDRPHPPRAAARRGARRAARRLGKPVRPARRGARARDPGAALDRDPGAFAIGGELPRGLRPHLSGRFSATPHGAVEPGQKRRRSQHHHRSYPMKSRVLLGSAFGSALTMALAIAASSEPAPPPGFKSEKCFGVAKAAKNDCQTSNTSCASTSRRDGQPDAWIYVPAGTCERLVGGSLEPKKS